MSLTLLVPWSVTRRKAKSGIMRDLPAKQPDLVSRQHPWPLCA